MPNTRRRRPSQGSFEATELNDGIPPSQALKRRNRWLLLVLTLILPLLGACNMTPRLETSADGQSTPYTQVSITVRNAGGGTLHWEISSDNPYLNLRNSYGGATRGGALSAGQSAKVFLTVDGRLAHPSTGVNATLSLTSNGGNRNVPISVGTVRTCEAVQQTYAAHAAAVNPLAGHLATASPGGLGLVSTPGEPVPVGNEILVSYSYSSGSSYGSGPPTGTIITTQSLEAMASATRAELTTLHDLATLEAGNGAVPDLLVAPDGANVDDLLALLRSDPRVAAAQRNYYVHLQQFPGPPNDPYYASQWTLSSFGVPEAWAHLAGAVEREIVLAVLDSGVDSSHPDLAAKMLPGYDFFRNSPNADPVYLAPGAGLYGKVAHGTHVAGIAAAMANDLGIVGVAYQPEVKVLPVKLFDDCGDVGKLDALVKAVYWAAGFEVPGAPQNPHAADIINLSLGLPGRHEVLDQATSAAFAAGSLVIAAAGNHTGGTPSQVLSPANGPDVLAVGSVDEDRHVSVFSNHGAQLNVVAPGGFGNSGPDTCDNDPPRVISTVPHLPGGPDELGYGCLIGTSMAAPFVAGVAALVMLQDATATAAEVFSTLVNTTLLEPHMTNANLYGAGIVCADAALGAATQCGGP